MFGRFHSAAFTQPSAAVLLLVTPTCTQVRRTLAGVGSAVLAARLALQFGLACMTNGGRTTLTPRTALVGGGRQQWGGWRGSRGTCSGAGWQLLRRLAACCAARTCQLARSRWPLHANSPRGQAYLGKHPVCRLVHLQRPGLANLLHHAAMHTRDLHL